MRAHLETAPAESSTDGFTLIELLVVVIIIGILAAIALSTYLGETKKGVDASLKTDLRNAAIAEQTYLADNDTYTTNTSLLPGFDPSVPQGTPDTITATVSPTGSDWFCLTAQNTNADNGGPWYLDSQNGQVTTSKPTNC